MPRIVTRRHRDLDRPESIALEAAVLATNGDSHH
jgi:hypothetical protein